MSTVDFEAGTLASISVGGVEYLAEDGVITVPAEFAGELTSQGHLVLPPKGGAVSTVILPPNEGPKEDEDAKADAGSEDPPVVIDGVTLERDDLIEYLTNAGQKPHPNTGDKKLRAAVRAILTELNAV